MSEIGRKRAAARPRRTIANYWNCVYGLVDPRDRKVHYIGQAANAEVRFWYHIRNAKRGLKTPKYRWIRELLDLGLMPRLKVLQNSSPDNIDKAEIKWIKVGREKGWPLTNLDDGGRGYMNWSQSRRMKRRKQ